MKYDILNSIKSVVKNAKYVRIKEDNINNVMDFYQNQRESLG